MREVQVDRTVYGPFLLLLEPQQLAVIAMHCTLHAIMELGGTNPEIVVPGQTRVTRLAVTIGRVSCLGGGRWKWGVDCRGKGPAGRRWVQSKQGLRHRTILGGFDALELDHMPVGNPILRRWDAGPLAASQGLWMVHRMIYLAPKSMANEQPPHLPSLPRR